MGFYKPDDVTKSEPVVVLAKVVRTQIVQTGTAYNIAAKFVGIDGGDQLGIKNYILFKSKKTE